MKEFVNNNQIRLIYLFPSFSLPQSGIEYQTDNFFVKLDKQTFKIIEFTGAENESFYLDKAVEMRILIMNYEL